MFCEVCGTSVGTITGGNLAWFGFAFGLEVEVEVELADADAGEV